MLVFSCILLNLRDVILGADLQKCPRSRDPEHTALEVYAFPFEGKGVWIYRLSLHRGHRRTQHSGHPLVINTHAFDRLLNKATLSLEIMARAVFR